MPDPLRRVEQSLDAGGTISVRTTEGDPYFAEPRVRPTARHGSGFSPRVVREGMRP